MAFACFVLPEDLKLSSNLVPALRSSWLVMHVSVVMLSYAALIIGSLLSMSVLFINKNKPLQIRSSSTGIGGFKLSNSYPVNDLVEPIEFSHSEELDTLSYRSILIGFVLLTLGLISGAVWANESLGYMVELGSKRNMGIYLMVILCGLSAYENKQGLART